jgi:hypothetical protein
MFFYKRQVKQKYRSFEMDAWETPIMIAFQIRYPDNDRGQLSSWRDIQKDVHITSFTIGAIDVPLLGRQFKVPNAGNCCLVRGDIKISVTRIIAVIELILKSISPVCQSVDAPLQDLVKCRWRYQIFYTDLFSYIYSS